MTLSLLTHSPITLNVLSYPRHHKKCLCEILIVPLFLLGVYMRTLKGSVFALLAVGVLSACGQTSQETNSSAIGTPSLTNINSEQDLLNLSGQITIDRSASKTSSSILSTQAIIPYFPPPVVPPVLPPEKCTNHVASPVGSHGYISVQQDPSVRSIPWGFYMYSAYRPYYTNYKVSIKVNGAQIDYKNQAYAAHGTIPATKIRKGDRVVIQGYAVGPSTVNPSYETYIQLTCDVAY